MYFITTTLFNQNAVTFPGIPFTPREIMSAHIDFCSAFYKAAAANTQKYMRPAKVGVFPGSFDPVTSGHIDVLIKAAGSGKFSRIAVMVGNNPDKEYLFNMRERASLMQRDVRETVNPELTRRGVFCPVSVHTHEGQTAAFIRNIISTSIWPGAHPVLVRGVRNREDLAYERIVRATVAKELNESAYIEMELGLHLVRTDGAIRNISSTRAREESSEELKTLVPEFILGPLTERRSQHADNSMPSLQAA